MNFKRFSLAFVVTILLSASAFAWNCSDPLASRVPVGTTQPSGTAGDGDGQWFLGTGSEGTKGVYYVCEVPKKPKSGGGKSGASSTSTSTSGASSTSGATATGGTSSATGGSVSGSGNSTVGPISTTSGVKNSGNSSNTNNNTANGGAGGAGGAGGNANQNQTQQQSNTSSNANNSSANGNGAGAGANSNNTTNNVAASQIPVATAFAPTTIPTVSCFKGFGAGVQTMPVGASFGGGKIDPNCRALQTALHAPNRLTYCKLFIQLQDSKKAGITMDDCMGQDAKEEVPASPAPPAPQPINIYTSPVAETPAPIAPPEYKTEITVLPDQLMWSCTFANALSCKGATGPSVISVSSICKSMLLQAKKGLLANPNSILIVTGNRNPSEEAITAASRAANVKKQLVAFGIPSSRIKTEVGNGTSRTVEVVLKFNADVTTGN
jgi:hypothetical protein